MSHSAKKSEDTKIASLPSVDLLGAGNAVPTFLLKLVALLQEPEYRKYVSWNEDGTSFVVHDQANFSKHVLPKFFKHNKFASFVRQLNMYGFRKLTALLQGTLEDTREAVEFFHPLFQRDDLSLLQHIKRKVAQPSLKMDVGELGQVLEDVQDVKNTQLGISTQLSELRRENEDLWREVVSLRQKHAHQQKVVNRLIQFLVSLVQHHGVGVKRALPLMIGDGSEAAPSFNKYSKGASGQVGVTPSQVSTTTVAGHTTEDSGPLITELFSGKPSDTTTLQSRTDPVPVVETNFDGENDFDIDSLMNSDPVVATGKVTNAPRTDKVVDHVVTAAATIDMPSRYLDDAVAEVRDNSSNFPNPTDFIAQRDLSPSATAITSGQHTVIASDQPAQQLALTSSNLNPPTQALNSNIDVIQNNLNSIQRRLSNNEDIQLDYDLIRELFNSSVDITPQPPPIDNILLPAGNELVQYTGDDENTFSNRIAGASAENLDEMLNLLES